MFPHKDNIAYFGEGDDEAHMVYQFSLPPLVLHAVQNRTLRALCAWAQNLTLPSSNTTWFNFLPLTMASGLTHCGVVATENEILALVEVLQQEGALVNWKIIPTVRVAPMK